MTVISILDMYAGIPLFEPDDVFNSSAILITIIDHTGNLSSSSITSRRIVLSISVNNFDGDKIMVVAVIGVTAGEFPSFAFGLPFESEVTHSRIHFGGKGVVNLFGSSPGAGCGSPQ